MRDCESPASSTRATDAVAKAAAAPPPPSAEMDTRAVETLSALVSKMDGMTNAFLSMQTVSERDSPSPTSCRQLALRALLARPRTAPHVHPTPLPHSLAAAARPQQIAVLAANIESHSIGRFDGDDTLECGSQGDRETGVSASVSPNPRYGVSLGDLSSAAPPLPITAATPAPPRTRGGGGLRQPLAHSAATPSMLSPGSPWGHEMQWGGGASLDESGLFEAPAHRPWYYMASFEWARPMRIRKHPKLRAPGEEQFLPTLEVRPRDGG